MKENDKKLYEKIYKKIRRIAKLPSDKSIKEDLDDRQKENLEKFKLYWRNFLM